MIYWLKKLEDASRIPVLPVYLDSPMAIEALQRLLASAATSWTRTCRPARGEVSRLLHDAVPDRDRRRSSRPSSPPRRTPCIVISSSGMATGGRVLTT